MLDGLQARLASYKLGGDLSGTLHIAGPADFIAARLADGLAPLMEQGLRIRVHTGNRERIYGLLGDASADLAVTASLPDERAHGYARLLTERFQLVLAPALAASLDKRALAAGLASLPLIAYDEDLPLVRPVWNAMFRLPRLAGGHDHPGPAHHPGPGDRGPRLVRPARLSVRACPQGRPPGRLAPRRAVAQRNDLYLVWNKGAMRNPRTVHARDAILRLFDSA